MLNGGGWKNVSKVYNYQDLWARYDESGLLTMILQNASSGTATVRALHVPGAIGGAGAQVRSGKTAATCRPIFHLS